MKQSIYFASTILHFYAASSIAADRDEVAHIVFIDQPKGKPFPLADIAREWPSSPFQSVRLFHGRFKGIINKLHQRKKLFSQLKKLIFDIRPSHIFVGNDRRIEFQFCMHCANKIKAPAIGHYMDEGTYTYVGRKASSSFGDTIIDNFLKKMSYGLWWKNPKTVGESAWISDIHVAFPELIDERLKNKKIRQLDHNRFISPEIMQLSESILKFYGGALSRLSSLDA
jgi:hypothetical protein